MQYDKELRVSLEMQIISSLISYSELFFTKKHSLKPDMFIDDKHKTVYTAIERAAEEFSQIDLTTISQCMTYIDEEEMTIQKILSLLSEAKSCKGKYFDELCEKLFDYNSCDQIIEINEEISSTSFNEVKDVTSTLNNWSLRITESVSETNSDFLTIEQQAEETLELIKQRMNSESVVSGLNTSIPNLSDFTSGWMSPDLIILAARPGMGKTAYAVFNAFNLALQEVPVAFYSYEMEHSQLINRSASSMNRINSKKFIKGTYSMEEFTQMEQAMKRLSSTDFIIIDKALPLSRLLSNIRYQKRKNNIQIAFVDYCQLVPNDIDKTSNKNNLIEGITGRLKQLALELRIPIMLLSQLSRGVEHRPTKMPMLSDLRDSGAIEQDADIVIMMWKPDYYEIELDDYSNLGHGLCRFMIKKGRQIGLADIDTYLDVKTNHFEDWDNNK